MLFFGKSDHVHFKKKDSINSVISNGKSFLRITDEEGKTILKYSGMGELNVTYGSVIKNHKALVLPIVIDRKNKYEMEMLSYPIKQVRLIRKKEKCSYNYYVQLCLEGKPAIKYATNGTLKHPIGSGAVGLYITTTTLTVASEQGIQVYKLSEANKKAEIEELQRFMDRSRRATNPDNYNSDGTIKNGRIVNGQRLPLEWNLSKQYLKARDQVAELNRKDRVQRQLHHQKLANTILELGNDIRVNDFAFARVAMRSKDDVLKANGTPASKKRGGKNINENAPAMLLQMIERKLQNIDGSLMKINLYEIEGFSSTKDANEAWAEYLFEL